MGWCATRRDIHCCMRVSYPSLNAWGWWDELLIALISPSWLTPSLFYQGLLTNCIQNTRCWVPSQHRKWDGVLQWVISITAGVYQYPPPMYVGKWDELLASDSIYKHLVVHIMIFLCKTDFKTVSKIPYDGYPLSMGNGMMCCKDTHPLLLKYRKPFMACMRKLRWASDIIYMPNVVYFVRFSLKFTLNLHPKYVILGTLSAWEMGWCATRRDIHCCMSVS